MGRWDEAYAYTLQVLSTKNRSLLYTGFTCWFEIEALLRVGEAEKAQTHLHDLVQQDSHNPRLRLACEHAQAVWAAAEGQTVTAISHLETAVNLADEMGLPGEQWQILAKLSELYSDKVKQQAAKNQAAEIVNRLAEQMGDEKLREGFTTAVTAHIL